jgi:hypothetical protein
MQYSILASTLPRPNDKVGSAPAPSAPPAEATTANTVVCNAKRKLMSFMIGLRADAKELRPYHAHT